MNDHTRFSEFHFEFAKATITHLIELDKFFNLLRFFLRFTLRERCRVHSVEKYLVWKRVLNETFYLALIFFNFFTVPNLKLVSISMYGQMKFRFTPLSNTRYTKNISIEFMLDLLNSEFTHLTSIKCVRNQGISVDCYNLYI